MKGLDLSEAFFAEVGAPMLADAYGGYTDRIAAGLVGPGSDFYGFDDELSRDHDWGPGFCLWLTEKDFHVIGLKLAESYEALPKQFRGYTPSLTLPGEEKKRGVFSITGFYKRYIGMERPPETNLEWLSIPEESLSVAVNGGVFRDPLGEFSAFRNALLAYYPEDVLKKRLSASLFLAAQSGQYNYGRSQRRKGTFAANHALSLFILHVLKILHMLNGRYAPYYKWLTRSGGDLPLLGGEICALVRELCAAGTEDGLGVQEEKIERIADLLACELRRRGLSAASGNFLKDHSFNVHGSITDGYLTEKLPFLYNK